MKGKKKLILVVAIIAAACTGCGNAKFDKRNVLTKNVIAQIAQTNHMESAQVTVTADLCGVTTGYVRRLRAENFRSVDGAATRPECVAQTLSLLNNIRRVALIDCANVDVDRGLVSCVRKRLGGDARGTMHGKRRTLSRQHSTNAVPADDNASE